MSLNHSNSVLSIDMLNKSFKSVKAVNEISFSIEPGEIFAFLGPNGAGKTTTLRILLDIIRADSGKIHWNLNGRKGQMPDASQIGYLPEERGLYTDLPVIRSLIYLASIRGLDARNARQTAMEWLERLELADRAKEKLQTLSKGNQQKIQFVASILHKPAFAILDEPFSGLDPLNQEKFIGYIKDLQQQGTTILLSSHQMLLVEKIAGKVFFINKGKEVISGTLNEIYEKFGKNQSLEIRFHGEVPLEKIERLSCLSEFQISGSIVKIALKPGSELNNTLAEISKIEGIQAINSTKADLHDIFIHLVKDKLL